MRTTQVGGALSVKLLSHLFRSEETCVAVVHAGGGVSRLHGGGRGAGACAWRRLDMDEGVAHVPGQDGEPHHLGLLNLAQMFHQADAGDRTELVREHFTKMLSRL